MKISSSSTSNFLGVVLFAIVQTSATSASVAHVQLLCSTNCKIGNHSSSQEYPTKEKISKTKFFGLTGIFGSRLNFRQPEALNGEAVKESRRKRSADINGQLVSWKYQPDERKWKKGLGRTLNIPVQKSTGSRKHFPFGKKSVEEFEDPNYYRILNIKKRSVEEAVGLPPAGIIEKEEENVPFDLNRKFSEINEQIDMTPQYSESIELDENKRRFQFGKKSADETEEMEKRKLKFGKKSIGEFDSDMEKRKFSFGKKSNYQMESAEKKAFRFGKKAQNNMKNLFDVVEKKKFQFGKRFSNAEPNVDVDKRKFQFGKRYSQEEEDLLEEKRKFQFGKRSNEAEKDLLEEKRKFQFGKRSSQTEQDLLADKRKFQFGKRFRTVNKRKFQFGKRSSEAETERNRLEEKRKFQFGKKSGEVLQHFIEDKRKFQFGKRSREGSQSFAEDKRKFQFGKRSSEGSQNSAEDKRKFQFGKRSRVDLEERLNDSGKFMLW